MNAPKTTSPAMKNAAAAPYIYFDGAPSLGTHAGMIEIELAARALMPTGTNQAYSDLVCTAHLRCSVNAATNLRDAINQALDMLQAANTPKQ